jgi:microsomal dipeptidase-like Zn-dependent dipeptidase
MKKTQIPVIDLHSDLLSYLSHNPDRSPEDSISRCSYSQLRQGNVKLQTVAIFTTTEEYSTKNGRTQVESYLKLLAQYPNHFAACRLPLDAQKTSVALLPAFENASTFVSETEPLADGIARLEEYKKALGAIFYISLTWDEENRFGGGNRSTVGLKQDGKHLLEWMDGKKIALDFSHTSDKLAYDLLHFIDDESLDIPIIASHSNFRAISNYPRNLPDEIAKQIIHRKGLIGLNLFAPFIHETDPSAIARHVDHALGLGAENALCFGADFFCDSDNSGFLKEKYHRMEAYYPQFSNASAYPELLQLFSQKLELNEQVLLKISSQNALTFLKEQIFVYTAGFKDCH